MAQLGVPECRHDENDLCSCLKFEGKTYAGLESIIDALVEERDNLLSYVQLLEKEMGRGIL